MSNLVRGRQNRGAYDQPFSGVGVEFDPLGVKPDTHGMILHETGFDPGATDWNYPAVFSPFWRLYHNSQRGHCVLFGERMIELEPAHLMLIPPHHLFHCLGGNPVPAFWMSFSFTGKLAAGQAVPALLPARDTELCLIRDLSALVEADLSWEPTDALRRQSLALLQIVLSRPELSWRPPVPPALSRIAGTIEARIGGRLAVPSLARLAGMSLSSFNRAFHRHFGCSPVRYITEIRVREAARLLLESPMSIEEIAERTGFPNRAYLSRVFRRITGGGPAGFRRKHRR